MPDPIGDTLRTGLKSCGNLHDIFFRIVYTVWTYIYVCIIGFNTRCYVCTKRVEISKYPLFSHMLKLTPADPEPCT